MSRDGPASGQNTYIHILCMLYILSFPLFVTGDHCSCFSDDWFQPDTAIFKSDGSDVYAYIICTWWSGVARENTISISILGKNIINNANIHYNLKCRENKIIPKYNGS